MQEINRKLIWLFSIIFVVQNLLFEVSVGAESCPKRTDYDSRCKKQCTSDKNCKIRKNRVKKCLCDGVCGLSCIRVGQRCREESTMLTKLKRGFVKLNGQPYQKRTFKFGDEITYTCKNGFTLSGPSKLVCSGIGKWKPWDQGKPSCRRECKNPGAPKDGRMIGGSFEVGKVVRFRCNPGYVREGVLALTCMPNLQWNGRKPTCKVLTCKDPEIPENGRISRGKQFSYQYGDFVFLSCNSGYSRIGNPMVICDINGWKSRSKLPTCAPKSCGHPGYVRNGNAEGTVFTYKSIVKFTCDKGYEMTRGNAYRRCLENQRWSGAVPYCERVDCGRPKDLANGVYESFGTRYGDRQQITCNNGYKLNGQSEITCQSNGQWSYEPRCDLVRCDSSYNSIDHGIVRGTLGASSCNNSYNCRLDFGCFDGYYLDAKDNKIAICQANGQWSASKPSCKPKDCGYPSVPQYGNLLPGSDNFFYPSVIQYGCNEKYVLFGSKYRSCLSDGRWSNQVPNCRANCSDPGTPSNGKKIGDSVLGGDVIEFKCNDGYEMTGEARITCNQINARWSHPIPQCNPKHCGRPRDLARGNFVGRPSFYYPSIVRYECNENYVMRGDPEITCEANGQWNRDAPSCVANCGDPGKPKNGTRIGDEFLANNIVTFKCDIGYRLIGDDSTECRQYDARWSKGTPSCEIMKCRDPTGLVDNGFVNFDKLTYQSMVSFGCNDGFLLDGAKNLTCGADGNWNGRFPSCKGIRCVKPKPLLNGGIVNKVEEYSYPAEIEYKCNEGFDLNGSSKVNCLTNGNWSQLTAICKEIVCSNLSRINNGTVDTSKALINKDNTHKYKSEVSYSCDKGFVLNGEKLSTCERGGWSGGERTCTVVDCGKPDVPNGVIDGNQTTYESTVRITCKHGYKRTESDEMIVCQENGQWSNLPECKAVDCGKPVVANSIFDGRAETTFRSSLKITCREGFILSGEDDITCQANGDWSSLPECREITCKIPSDLANGNIDTAKSLLNDHTMHRYKSEVAYVCNKGFELSGEKVSTCGKDGWTGGARTCTEVKSRDGSCDTPLGMKNSEIKDEQISFQTYSLHHQNSKGRFNGKEWCGSFKKYHGEVSAQIKFNSVVQIKKISFQDIQYDQKYEVTQVFLRYYDAEDKNHVFKVTPKDNKRYDVDLQNNTVFDVTLDEPIKCSYFEIVFLKNGGTSDFVCSRFEIYGCNEASTCGIPESPINGEALGMIYRNGDQAVYSCNSGFKLESDEKQICSSNGSWTGDIPKCVQEPNYLGCYKDRANRVLIQWRSNHFSPEECLISCKNIFRIQVAGFQYSSQCFCGYESKLHSQKTEDRDRECYIPCNKDVSRKCGGPWRNSVYRIQRQ